MSVQADQAVAAPHVYRPKATAVCVSRWLAFALFALSLYWSVDHFLFREPARTSLVRAAMWTVIYVPSCSGRGAASR
jgi:hypothetical protein